MSEVPPPDPKRRLFFALWPADELRRQIEESTVGLARHSGGRVVPARNFHVTLAFVGEVTQEQMSSVLSAAEATSASRFSLVLDQIEAWSKANVLVLDTPRTPPELALLVDRLHFNLLEKQIKLKREVYRPHLTLARKLPGLRALQKIAPFNWAVHEFALVESSTTGKEAGFAETRYAVLARWSLA
ncbi:MAG TPA: RNA 2',3'-cyclic phosphodiesterase [Steroidobacteraceae bacterium]|jgi:2'-5' RNA ligase